MTFLPRKSELLDDVAIVDLKCLSPFAESHTTKCNGNKAENRGNPQGTGPDVIARIGFQ